MRSNLSSLAWFSIIAALAAWAGVVLFALSIETGAQSVTARAGDAQTARDKQALALKMHTLARDISPGRVALEQVLATDPVSITEMISQAGKDAGVALHVSDAISENAAAPTGARSAGSANLPHLSAIEFTVEADGSFADLVRSVAFLESLPVPSKVEQLDLDRSEDSKGAPTSSWHLRAQVRILTRSIISS